jgi:hypothetical protein
MSTNGLPFRAPKPYPANRSEFGTARIASWALIITKGKTNNPSVNPPERMVLPLRRLGSTQAKCCSACDACQGAHEDCQTQDTIND